MRWISWLSVVVVCAVIAGFLGLYKYNEIQASIARGKSFPEPAEAVEVYTVRQVSQRPTLSVTGEIMATQTATLQNELKGRIVEVGFVPGARIQAGQVLLRLDSTQERAQLAEARADQDIARLALDRAGRLVKRGAGSVEAKDQARAQFEASKARVTALSALIDKKTLRAPFDATTSLHELEEGQYLEAGTHITELVGVSNFLWVDFALPQDNARVSIGSEVEITLEASGAAYPAQIIARDAAINVRSRNLRLRARLPARSEVLLPGMLVRVIVPLGDAAMVTVIPPTSVRRDALGASVYVLEQVIENDQTKTRARRQKVTLAQVRQADLLEDFVVVLEGLDVGQEIAAIGAFKLRDGALVMPGEPEPGVDERTVGR